MKQRNGTTPLYQVASSGKLDKLGFIIIVIRYGEKDVNLQTCLLGTGIAKEGSSSSHQLS